MTISINNNPSKNVDSGEAELLLAAPLQRGKDKDRSDVVPEPDLAAARVVCDSQRLIFS